MNLLYEGQKNCNPCICIAVGGIHFQKNLNSLYIGFGLVPCGCQTEKVGSTLGIVVEIELFFELNNTPILNHYAFISGINC
jgi:hypothetical protein